MPSNQKSSNQRNDGSAGGSATAGGVSYQAQVTAWWAARMLLQTPEVGKEFDLPALVCAERIHSETGDGIDDIRIELSDGSLIFGQCKKSLSMETRPDSQFGGVFVQFLKELRKLPSAVNERKFVLFYGRPTGTLEHLGSILDRYRKSPNGSSLSDATRSKLDEEIVGRLDSLLDSLLSDANFQDLSDSREILLRHTCFKRLEVFQGQPDYREAFESLRSGLLARPDQISSVMEKLHLLADDLMIKRSSVGREDLRSRLQGAGIVLRDSINLRPDLKRIDDWSREQIATEEAHRRHQLSVRGRDWSVARSVVQDMVVAAQRESFVLVGDAGVGKTGCLLKMAEELRTLDIRRWYVSANSQHRSLQQIRDEIRLDHTWEEVLEDAASGVITIFIIDGLDGLRDTDAMRAYRNLMALAIKRGIRVVASIRSFDLKNSKELRDLLRPSGQPVSKTFSSPDFSDVKHVYVSELDDGELAELQDHLSAIRDTLDFAPDLKRIVANLFNLGLLCQLIDLGIRASEFKAVATQAGLFRWWWERRIEGQPLEQEILKTLKAIVESMVDQRSLTAKCDWQTTDVKKYLLSASILRNPPQMEGRLPTTDLVEFSHHYLFDYMAMKLYVEPRKHRLAEELAGYTNWGLFLRPSLVLFFRHTWLEARGDFWDKFSAFAGSSVLFLQKMAAYVVVASGAASAQDFSPLLDSQRCPDKIRIVQGIVSTARHHSLKNLFSQGNGDWWLEFAVVLIRTAEEGLVYAGRVILACAADELRFLSDRQRELLNDESVALIRYYWSGPDINARVHAPLEWMCQTITCNPEVSREVIRRVLSKEQLESTGYIQARAVSYHIRDIWNYDPALAVEVYRAVFSYRETDETPTSFSDSLIFQITSTRKQDYQSIRYLLRTRFATFLHEHPPYATGALIFAVKNWRRLKFAVVQEGAVETFQWNNRECRINNDVSWLRSSGPPPDDDEGQMLVAWESYLRDLPDVPVADDKWGVIEGVLISENESCETWRSLLNAGCERPEFYAARLVPLLLVPRILFGPGTRTMARNCIRSFAPYLTEEALHTFQSVVLAIADYAFPGLEESSQRELQLKDLKVMLLADIPVQLRVTEASAFLSSCDSEMVQAAEDRTYEPDEIIYTHSWESNGSSPVERPAENADEVMACFKYLAVLSPDQVTVGNVAEVVTRIQDSERLLRATAADEKYNGASIRDWVLSAWTAIAHSAVPLDLLPTEDMFALFHDALIVECPEPSRTELQQFDEFPGYGYPDPLVLATKGLLGLAAKTLTMNSKWLQVLETVANHPYPRVRFQLVDAFQVLMPRLPEFVFLTVEQWVREAAVLPGRFALLKGCLRAQIFGSLRIHNAHRTTALIGQLYAVVHERGSRELRVACGKLIGLSRIRADSDSTNDLIPEAISALQTYIPEISGFI